MPRLHRGALIVCSLLGACGEPAPDAAQPVAPPPRPAAVPLADPPPVADPDAAAAPPRLDDALQYELHGRHAGEPFWARLGPLDPTLEPARLRWLDLQYRPPAPDALGGSLLSDCPRLAVTSQLYISLWEQEGGGISQAVYDPAGRAYQVERWAMTAIGNDRIAAPTELRLQAPPSWDRRLWPIALAFAWQAGGAHRVALIDLYGDGGQTTLEWNDAAVRVGADAWTIAADATGRLASLADAAGAEVLSVAGRAAPLDAAGIEARRVPEP